MLLFQHPLFNRYDDVVDFLHGMPKVGEIEKLNEKLYSLCSTTCNPVYVGLQVTTSALLALH